MRTKALLSVAAIAASAVTAMAQSSVYSLNIVGYATVNLPAGYSLLANPLSAGATNGANEIGLTITGEQILTWNGKGYNTAVYDPTTIGWQDLNGNPSVPPSLPPGTGFFFFNPNSATNITFVGQVVPGPSSTNSLALPAGYSLVGSPLPANVTNISSAPVSLPLITGMQILTWNGTGYVGSLYDPTTIGWQDINGNPQPAPTYSIGEGFFFFNPNAATTWPQSLP
jgi:hypothetical protein